MIIRDLVAVVMLCASLTAAEQAEVTVDLAGPALPVTRTMTGACLEDVNHEVYGGIDSQMLYGESFQEPPLSPPLADAQIFGGDWSADDGVLRARNRGRGPRLVSAAAPAAVGRVGVDIRLPAGSGGNAALLINVGAQGGVGADSFDGYEIALRAGVGLNVGRHRHDYHALGEVPCAVPSDTWIHLEVRFGERDFEVSVDGKSVFTHADPQSLPPGTVGLRLWDRDAEFRGWWREVGGVRQDLPFAYPGGRRDWRQVGVSGMWRGFSQGDASGAFAEVAQGPFAGLRSQRLAFTAGAGAVGIENRGLDRRGLFLRAGMLYEGFVYLRAADPLPSVAVALQDADGGTAAESPLPLVAGDAGWRRYGFTLTPSADVRGGRFALMLRRPGTIEIGYAFLQPGPWGRFRDLPVRKDVVEALIDQGVTVLRYGGSMVNSPHYRWKNMTGPREFRPPTPGTWHEYSSNGWAIPDFLNLCEAMQVVAIPDIDVNEDPREVADLVDYANGPPDSPGGRRRAADGHPRPYNLEYLQIGNEEHVDDAYAAKFAAIAEAVWSQGQRPVLVVGDFAYSRPVVDPFHLTGQDGAPSLAVHQKILAMAKRHDREVWFDMHIWNQRLTDRAHTEALPSVIDALTGLADGARFKVAVFELNADTHSMERAVQNAFATNRFIRLGGKVPVVCSANCLQVDGANDNGWDQGLLFLNPEKVWPQPPYYVTRMMSRHWLPKTVPATSSHPRLDVTALVSEDHRVVQLNVVNTARDQAITARIAVPGFVPAQTAATITTLTGAADAVNDAEHPERVKPVETTWTHGLANGSATYVFPPLSFIIMRFE